MKANMILSAILISLTLNACLAGEWDDAGTCKDSTCDAGMENKTTTATATKGACTDCPAGQFGAGGKVQCAACAVGTWSAVKATTCSDSTCDAGMENKTTDAILTKGNCTDCPAGQFGAGGKVQCAPCVTGKYSAAKATTCTDCATGKRSAPGATVCDAACPAGYFAGSTLLQCDASTCVAGESNPTAGSTTTLGNCAKCAAGTWGAGAAAQCADSTCEAGKANATTGATATTGGCLACAEGTASAGGAAQCAAAAGIFVFLLGIFLT